MQTKMDNSTRTCLQWTVVAFNTLSIVVGIFAASYFMFELDRYESASLEYTATIVEIVVALLLVASAFIGCFGAMGRSVLALVVYIALLVSLLATHLWELLRLLPSAADKQYDTIAYSFEKALSCGMFGFEVVGVLISLVLICKIVANSYKRAY